MPLNLPTPATPPGFLPGPKKAPLLEPETITSLRSFMTEYGLLSDAEMILEKQPKQKRQPPSWVVKFPYESDIQMTLFTFTSYANQPTLCEFYDTNTKRKTELDAVQAVSDLMRNARKLTLKAGGAKSSTGAALILQQQTIVPELSEETMLQALKVENLSGRKMLTLFRSNVDISDFEAAANMPETWLKKML